MKKEEKAIIKNVVYDGKILRLNRDEVVLENGTKAIREIIHHHGGVCVMAFVNGKIPLVKQFRYSYKQEMFELPAGKLEKGEDPVIAGIRELEEETGYRAESLTSLGFMYPSCGYTNEIIHLFVANNVKKTKRHLDEDENIDVYFFSLEEIVAMINRNEINDAKTICLVLKYLQTIK